MIEEDREGTMADLAHVLANFRMPGVDLVPDYDSRILKMRGEGGIDRNLFIRKVYLPILKHLGLTRHEMLAAQRAAIEAARRRESDVAPREAVETTSSAAE
jgi:acyl-[acyl-carrier-protein] desaturase